MAVGEHGPLTVGALGELMRLDSGTLSPLLKRMEAAGLVGRTRDPGDERRVLVALTDAGRERLAVADVPRRSPHAAGLPPLAAARHARPRLTRLPGEGPGGATAGPPGGLTAYRWCSRQPPGLAC